MANIIQFNSFENKTKKDYRLIPEFDIKTFISSLINDNYGNNQKPDMIFHLDSCGLFKMTSLYFNTLQPVINEVYFIPDLSDTEMISNQLLNTINNINFDKDNHKELAYGNIVKSRLLKWAMNEVDIKKYLPIYYKQIKITGMMEVPLCMVIFTKYFLNF